MQYSKPEICLLGGISLVQGGIPVGWFDGGNGSYYQR